MGEPLFCHGRRHIDYFYQWARPLYTPDNAAVCYLDEDLLLLLRLGGSSPPNESAMDRVGVALPLSRRLLLFSASGSGGRSDGTSGEVISIIGVAGSDLSLTFATYWMR